MTINLNCGIYQIRNIITNVCYSGQSIHLKQRPRQHWSSLKNNNHWNKYLQRSYNKHGRKNFIFEILIYCEFQDLTKYEQLFCNIDKAHSLSYNIRDCVDSNRGIKFSEETRKRMSESNSGKNNGMFGRKHSKKSISEMSEIKKGEKNGMWGKHQTEESIKKISESKKGYVPSDEACKRMAKNHADVNGINNPNILKKEMVLKVLKLLEEDMPVSKILNKIRVGENTVYKIKNGWYDDIYDLPKDDK